MSVFKPDFAAARVRASPNFGDRRDGLKAELLILHYTGMKTGDAAEDRLCDPASEVSSHYLVHEDGSVVQMVREADRAWHAGKSIWQGVTDVNSQSIGVEIVNPGHLLGYPDFPPRQIRAVSALGRDIIRRRGIRPEHVLAHSDIAPGRKVDPGEKFPWGSLARQGVGHFVAPSRRRSGISLKRGDRGDAVSELRRMLAAYGYGLAAGDMFDAETETVVSAFQLHFRPRLVDGIADPATLGTLRRLLDTRPRFQD